MCENKKPIAELNDEALDQVSGGGDYHNAYLDDRPIPQHFVVTCLNCDAQFAVGTRKACPQCGHTEVYMGYSSDKPILP